MNTKPTQDAEIVPEDRALIRPAQQPVAEITPEHQERQKVTAQELRINEVGEALLPAYQKASTLELTDDEVSMLMLPFPDSAVEVRPHDGLCYIPHIVISDRLNKVFKPGKWALICRRHWLDGNTMYGEYVMLIRGCYVGESVGGHPYQPNNPKTNYSDTLESTAAEALRRIAGKRLSCGSQVWKPDYCREWIAKYAVQVNGKWRRRQDSQPTEEQKFAPVRHAEPTQSAPAPAPAPAKVVPMPSAAATDKTRDWMIGALLAKEGQANRQEVTEYFRRTGKLLPTEEVEDLPLKFVPTSKAALAELANAIAGLGPEKPADVPTEPEETESPADDRPHVTGKIERVTIKEGQSKKGAWKLYGICIDGGWLNTFDTKLGEQAQGLQGQEATVFYTENERGKTAVEIK